MKVQIGTGPDSWGVWFPSDPKQIPWERYLDEIVIAGYEVTELGPYGYLPTDPKKLGEELKKRNLGLESGLTFGNFYDPDNWKNLEEETLKAGELASSLGAKHHLLIDVPYTDLFTGKSIAPAKLNDKDWGRLVDTAIRLSDLLRDRFGLTGVFHPHAETHVEYEDQIERLLADSAPDRVSLCLDLGHHAYRGGDPVAFMRAHHERIPYLHLKSVHRDIQKKVEAEKIPFATAVAMDMFCEPSEGAVDFPAFVDLLKEIDYEGFGIVEQDMYPAPFDKPLPIGKRTRAYLREIGLG